MIQTVNIKAPAFQAQTKIQKSEPQLTFKAMTSQDCFIKTAQPLQQVAFTGLGEKIKHALKLDLPKAMRKCPEIQGLATSAVNNLDVEAFKTIESFAEADKSKAREIGEVRAYILDKVAERIIAPDAKPQEVNKKLEFLLKTGLAEDLTFDLIACKGKIDGLIKATWNTDLPISPKKENYKHSELYEKVLNCAMAKTSPVAEQFKQEYVDAAKIFLNKTQIDAFSTSREKALEVIRNHGNINDCLETLLAVAVRKEVKSRIFDLDIGMIPKTFDEEPSFRKEAVAIAQELLDKSDLNTTERQEIKTKLDAASEIIAQDEIVILQEEVKKHREKEGMESGGLI